MGNVPVNAVDRTRLYGLLDVVVAVDPLLHRPGPPGILPLHLEGLGAHPRTVGTSDARNFVHKYLHSDGPLCYCQTVLASRPLAIALI